MARVVARGEKQKQILRLRASRYAQDDRSEGGSAQDDIRRALGETFLLNDRVNQLLLQNLDAGAWRAKPPGEGVRTIAAIFSHMHNIRRKWLRLSLPHGPGPVSPLNQKKVEWATRPVSPLNQKKGTGRPGTRASRKELARAGSLGFGSAFELPEELNRARCTQKQAAAALKESAQLCAEMLADTRVKEFVRDGWAKPWGLAPSTTLRAGSQATALRAKTKTRAEAGVGVSLGPAAMLAYMVSHEAHHRGQVCMLAHQMGYRLPMKVMAKMWSWEGLGAEGSGLRKGKSAAR